MENGSAFPLGNPSKLGRREYDYIQVQHILQGKEASWELLYKTAYYNVLRCAKKADYQKLLQYYEYRDIVDEAFALCYAQLDKYRGCSQFAYWVGGYAKNITRNRYARERTRQKNLGIIKSVAIRQMYSYDPLMILIRRERNECLWKAFNEIDAVDRAVLILRIIDNKNFAEIARRLLLTRKEVLRRYGKAVIDLRQRFVAYYVRNGLEEGTN